MNFRHTFYITLSANGICICYHFQKVKSKCAHDLFCSNDEISFHIHWHLKLIIRKYYSHADTYATCTQIYISSFSCTSCNSLSFCVSPGYLCWVALAGPSHLRCSYSCHLLCVLCSLLHGTFWRGRPLRRTWLRRRFRRRRSKGMYW